MNYKSILLITFAAISIKIYAQANNCDEGVIRLVDRTGTIQICSGLAEKVPQLNKQLGDLIKIIGTQQQQIKELNRLIKGINNIGRRLDGPYQAEMIENLSKNISKDPNESGAENLVKINDQLDSLQASFLDAISNPKTRNELEKALKGNLGKAIANFDLSEANQQIENISERLVVVQSTVNDIRSETITILNKIEQVDKIQNQVDLERKKIEVTKAGLLNKISKEIQELSNQDGLIVNPAGYSSHYHNARILVQRGEVDLALTSYEKIFITKIQFADPLIDLTTLLTRLYGNSGALKLLDNKFKNILPLESYLYAIQLLSEKPLQAIPDLYKKNKEIISNFPPLGALYLKRQYEESEQDLDELTHKFYNFEWSHWTFLSQVSNLIKTEVENGSFLSFFVDQLRGRASSDEFRYVSKNFNENIILKTTLPLNNFKKGDVDPGILLIKSPVAIDYGDFDFFIWDKEWDANKEVNVCSSNESKNQCFDINSKNFRCGNQSILEPLNNCSRAQIWVRNIKGKVTAVIGTVPISPKKGWTPPIFTANFNVENLINSRCIYKIEYSTRSGNKITVLNKDILAVTRHSELQNNEQLRSCQYNYQN
jgi:hypothetical protein